MTGKASDPAGREIENRIATLKLHAARNDAGMTWGRNAMFRQKLADAELELVHHLLSTGRLSAATILEVHP